MSNKSFLKIKIKRTRQKSKKVIEYFDEKTLEDIDILCNLWYNNKWYHKKQIWQWK